MRFTRWKYATITAAAIGAATLAMPATASAAPASASVPGTSCTVGQVERSIAVNAPEVAGYLNNPTIRAEFERVITLPVAARRAEAQRYLDQYPQLGAYRGTIENRITLIETTCSSF